MPAGVAQQTSPARSKTTTLSEAADATASRPQPVQVENTALAALQLLLRVENDAREAADLRELCALMSNETRKLTRARQIFVVERRGQGRFRVLAVSSVVTTQTDAPLNQSIEAALSRLDQNNRLDDQLEFEAGAETSSNDDAFTRYPLRQLLWVPVKNRAGQTFAGLLQAREIPWDERDRVVSQRLAKTYGHAWAALTGHRDPLGRRIMRRRLVGAAAAVVLGLLFVPVPMSALAPAEIVPHKPAIVSAPIDGVIAKILVEPNGQVKAGQPLIALSDTKLRNNFEIADREVQVAGARLKRANQLAFQDVRGRHELGIARAELALRVAERNYARELLSKTILRAERDGIALFRDKKELVGKPVATGEKLMQLADPAAFELRIDMPVADGQLLQPGADAKVFLDSDPLNPLTARITSADYQARPQETGTLAFEARAAFKTINEAHAHAPKLRLGVRGTAQVYGDNVPLGIYLFRRPITAARQWLGI